MSTSSRIEIVDNSEMNRTTLAHKNGQRVDLQVQGMTINFDYSPEKWGWGILLMFYDPNTGLLAWEFSNVLTQRVSSISKTQCIFKFRTDRPYYIFVSNDKIVYFKVDTTGKIIDFQEFTERYATFSQAREKVLRILEEQIEKTELSEIGKWHHSIDLRQYLNYWYAGRRIVRWRKRIVDIYLETAIYENARWTLTLKSVEEDDNKRTKVQLDEHYNLLKIWGHGVFKNAENQNLMAPTRTLIHVVEGSEEDKHALNHPILKGDINIKAMTINYCLPTGKQGSGILFLWQNYRCHLKLFGWYFLADDKELMDKVADTQNPSGWQISGYPDYSDDKKIKQFLSKVYFFFLEREKMVGFMPHFPSEIWCQEFAEVQSDLHDGFRDMCHFLENRLFEVEDQDFGKWYKRIPIEKYLSRQFFVCSENNVVRENYVKISKVTYQNAKWQLKLESTPEKKPHIHKYATFILDEHYNVIKVLEEGAIKT